ncbi:protein phosphatase [Lithospermum erythrorhizon]|uniref:Protein phosphatase n=1 Tax=Lithospermum erythrorhizon TaxID=34254 RepID=A0AAV3QDT5_LITER
MKLYGQDAAKKRSQSEWAPASTEPGPQECLEEEIWEREEYPERVGVADCSYYMRTGVCGYGANCRFNHPPNHHQVGGGAAQSRVGEYPERVGEPACQYYLKMGTCKFGASCKFHHPRDTGGSSNVVRLNVHGFPLRPEGKHCSHYLKTGQCKYGITCKFHHPQPAGMSLPAAARPFYPTVQTVSVPPAEQHGGTLTSFSPLRPSALLASYVPGAYGTMMYHPGVLSLPNWSPYSGSARPTAQTSPMPSPYGMSQQLGTSETSLSRSYPPQAPLIPYSRLARNIQKELLFPERLGQPECQYYMKTGNCKFGSSCKYDHPPEVLQSKMNCSLSPLGLPLRPGVQPCTFYMQKGRCNFGHVCKFDHPMEIVKYSSSPHLTDVPVASYSIKTSGGNSLPVISNPDHQSGTISGIRVGQHVPSGRSSGIGCSSRVSLRHSHSRPVAVSRGIGRSSRHENERHH